MRPRQVFSYGLRLARPLAQVYVADNAIDLSLDPLRTEHRHEADEAFRQLQEITEKKLTEKYPGLPASDAIRHWDKLKEVLVSLAPIR